MAKDQKYKIIKTAALLLPVLMIAVMTSCCAPLESLTGESSTGDDYEDEGSQVNVDSVVDPDKPDESLPEINVEPVAVMDIYQQSSDGFYLAVGNPVFFSAENSSDADGDELSFRWNIDGLESASGESFSYTFSETGEYEITLTVYDGEEKSSVTRKVRVIELNQSIMIAREHRLTIEIEHIFKNSGPGNIDDIFCLMEVPQTYRPFQVVLDRRSNYAERDEVFSDGYNVIAQFKLGDLEAGQSVKAYIDCDVILYEYDYIAPGEDIQQYERADKDLETYTISEYFIDSDSDIIKAAAGSIAGNEPNPVAAARKLYDFVIGNLDYDYGKLESKSHSLKKASEILKEKAGICADYSILYAALCRARRIPAVVVQGVSVFGVLSEPDRELPYGHAWVEIKLPGYGWIPIDITPEEKFMGYNYFLNLQTYKGSGIFYRSLEIEGKKYYPTGFYYSWSGDGEPEVLEEISYRVSGLEISEVNVVAESDFLNSINSVLSEYSSTINDLNNAHGTDWIFNDPGEVAKEEAFLERLRNISIKMESISAPEVGAGDLSNMSAISRDAISYKESQIGCMKSGDYDCNMLNYNKFIDSVNALFDYYNNMVDRYNEKY